ncbi:hypothetical protein K3495_g6074 [Podosphaera aphanis]|nr:hypothetical protein K3495_g6074 [Podosphaera aphanis]
MLKTSTPLYNSRSDQPISWVKTLDNLPRLSTKTKSLLPVAQITTGTLASDATSSGKFVEPMVSQQRRSETQVRASKNRMRIYDRVLKSRFETPGATQHSRLETHSPASSLPNNKINPSNESDLQIDTRSGRAVGLNNKRVKDLGITSAILENKVAWEASILDELKSREENETFEIIEGDFNSVNKGKLMSSRWVPRNKLNADGTIARRKSRIVGKGYEQQHGIDYFETFASIIRYATLRAVISYSAVHNLELDHLDINTAFLIPMRKKLII